MKADRRKYNRTCKHCGKEFYSAAFASTGKYGIFCSKDCRLSYEYRIEKICIICGKTFFVKAYDLKRKPCLCCSRKCSGVLYSKNKNTETVRCQICGKEFNRVLSRKAEDRGKYCSKQCSNIAKEKQENCVCAYCGKLFSRKKSQTKSRNKFCSPDCKYSFSVKENHPSWKGGSTPERQRFYSQSEWKNLCDEIYKERDATCQLCGIKKIHGKTFHVHHIISFMQESHRMEKDNLVLLCKKCHNFVHSNKNTEKIFLEKENQDENT